MSQVVFQSGFVSALSQTAGMHRLDEKMADSNYPLLPTWATDCTNLHANGHVYYTRGIAKHKVPLINDSLCFWHQKKKKEIWPSSSPNIAVFNTQTANTT